MRAPPDGYTLLSRRCGQRDQRDTLRQAQFQFHPRHRAGRRHHPRASRHGGAIHRFRPRRFPSSLPMPRPIRARSIWRRLATGPRCMCPASLFKMMTDVDMIHVPYRGAGPSTHRSARRTSTGYVRQPCLPRSSTLELASCARSRSRPQCARKRCRTCRPWANLCRVTRRALVWRRRTQEHARRNRRQAQQGDQCRPRRSQDQGAACRPRQHRASLARPPTSGSSSPTKPRSGARWSSSRASSRSDPDLGWTFHKFRSANGWCPSVWAT